MCKRHPSPIPSPGTCGLLPLSPKTICPFVDWLPSSALGLECASGKADGGYCGAETGTSAVARPGYPSSGDPAIAAGPAAKPHVDSSHGSRTRSPPGAASTTSGPMFGTASPAPARARRMGALAGKTPEITSWPSRSRTRRPGGGPSHAWSGLRGPGHMQVGTQQP